MRLSNWQMNGVLSPSLQEARHLIESLDLCHDTGVMLSNWQQFQHLDSMGNNP